ncbi:MAG: lycopene cyclase domain-containing protein [Dehalococcoidia bacterium]
MSHVEYLAILAAGWASLLWADRRYAGVLRQWRRLLSIIALNLTLFLTWDSVGVHRGYWRSDPYRVLGIWPLPGVPIEELILLAMVTYASLVLWRIASTAGRRAVAEAPMR